MSDPTIAAWHRQDELRKELRRLHEVEVAYGVMMKQAESRIAELEQTLGQAVDMLEDAPYMSNKDDYRRYADVMQALRERLQKPKVEMDDPAIHYCHRFAILMECVMLGGVDKYWDEMGTLLDEYHKARDAWMTAHGQPYVSGFGKD